MKITIEPTEPAPAGTPTSYLHPTVTVSLPSEEATIEEVMELIRGALIAYGYTSATVDEYFKPE